MEPSRRRVPHDRVVTVSSPSTPAPAPPDDLVATVRAAQRGDAFAVDTLIDALAPAVVRVCRAIALQDADDAVQEALIAVLRGLPGLREPAAVRGWTHRIAAREAVRVARAARQRRGASSAAVAPEDLPALGEPLLGVELRDQLARLEPAQRAIIVLRDLEGLDEAAVARLLDVPLGTVKSRLHRARARFRQEWSA
jgi:RNA polymerase sigma factor (sigma-70 family)